MARFRPFCGLRFDPERVGGLDEVVSPPYDVISPKARDALYRRSPYNVTRLILNREGHEQAAALFKSWRDNGLCRLDPAPAFYLYTQDFTHRGRGLRRSGVIGALALEPFSTGTIRPHERTFAHHKTDRLALTRQVRANLSPIFGLFSNSDFHPRPEGGWEQAPEIDVVHDGVRHRLWTLTSPQDLAAVEEAVEGRTVFIADGHHRYETALNYYAATRDGAPPEAAAEGGDGEQPQAYVMAFLAAFEDPGMVILPTHRELLGSDGADHRALAEYLEKNFEVTTFERSRRGRDALAAALDQCPAGRNCFAVSLANLDRDLMVCAPVGPAAGGVLAGLDLSVLHEQVLGEGLEAAGGGSPELAYTTDASALLERVAAGRAEGAFIVRATRPEQLSAVCMADELMPQKSTYFFPKLLTGLVFHLLERATDSEG